MVNTAKLAEIHYSPCKSTTDCTTHTMLTETLHTTKFIEVTSHTGTGSNDKDSEKATLSIAGTKQHEQGLSEKKNLKSEPQTKDLYRKLITQEKQSLDKII